MEDLLKINMNLINVKIEKLKISVCLVMKTYVVEDLIL